MCFANRFISDVLVLTQGPQLPHPPWAKLPPPSPPPRQMCPELSMTELKAELW